MSIDRDERRTACPLTVASTMAQSTDALPRTRHDAVELGEAPRDLSRAIPAPISLLLVVLVVVLALVLVLVLVICGEPVVEPLARRRLGTTTLATTVLQPQQGTHQSCSNGTIDIVDCEHTACGRGEEWGRRCRCRGDSFVCIGFFMVVLFTWSDATHAAHRLMSPSSKREGSMLALLGTGHRWGG